MMWNLNEGDILEETILNALLHVDSLFIADDGSTDNSWELIQSMKGRYSSKIEHIQQLPSKLDPAQRTSLLTKIRSVYSAADTWVQVIESDIMILDTDVREAIKSHSDYQELAVSWQTLNAVRKKGTWTRVDTYPNWNTSITEIMPYAHFMETMLYTFRPLARLYYKPNQWRPWPSGWTYYTDSPVKNTKKYKDSPLLAHYGYRGPTHFYKKYQKMGSHHKKYKNWNLSSIQTVEETVAFFNGTWNTNIFPMSRRGWKKRWK